MSSMSRPTQGQGLLRIVEGPVSESANVTARKVREPSLLGRRFNLLRVSSMLKVCEKVLFVSKEVIRVEA
jgi:hypothetical protein